MTYDEIIQEITGGLTGDRATDVKYLQMQVEKYKKHELAQEIFRECGRMLYELILEEDKNKFEQTIEDYIKTIETMMDEIRYCIYSKNMEKAMQLSEKLVRQAEANPMYQNDGVSEYYTFGDFFEELLYRYFKKTSKKIRHAEIPFAEIYLQHGCLLFEHQQYEQARTTLEKARRWNPVNAEIAFEYMETFKATGDLEQFFKLTKEAFSYSFRATDVARCYRNLGFYFVEKNLYKEAAGCYLMSLQFNKDSQNAQSELYYIHSKAPKGFFEPTPKEVAEYGKKYGFPVGASEDILGLAFSYGKHFAEQNQKEAAIYCLKIVYELTDDQRVKNMIQAIESK